MHVDVGVTAGPSAKVLLKYKANGDERDPGGEGEEGEERKRARRGMEEEGKGKRRRFSLIRT